jgi:arginyl-tRNA--protein-N-Asp/Glu arginylyltransferase
MQAEGRHNSGMLVVQQFITDPHTCAYLPERMAKLEYSFAMSLAAQEYEDLMNKGYRKFGSAFFRPVCVGCSECRPIRIPVERFEPDRSQKRAWKRNADLDVRIGQPVCDKQHLELYHRYHAEKTARSGWPEQHVDADEYEMSLVQNPVPCVEISFWEGQKLRAVVINDLTPNVVSAIYHFHDPDCADRGLGTYSILHCIEFAKKLNKRWVYLGYYVDGSASMKYKARFKPYEIMDLEGNWREQ